jgi:hypothetical protein
MLLKVGFQPSARSWITIAENGNCIAACWRIWAVERFSAKSESIPLAESEEKRPLPACKPLYRKIIAYGQKPVPKNRTTSRPAHGIRVAGEEVDEMGDKLSRFQKITLAGAATATLLWLPCPAHGQSSSTQDRQAVQSDDITRRDLARFDQFLDSHHEIAGQLRKTPSLIDDPQFLQSHPELNTYLQDHPSVKQEISEQPDTFMRLEDRYSHDANLRDHDAGGQDRDAGRRDVTNRDGDRREVANRDADRRDVASFDRFLDDHREIGEQVRKDPSLLDNRNFVQNHPILQTYLRDNPGVRDQTRQDPGAFMRQEDAFNRDSNMRDGDSGAGRDQDRRHVANFDRFLDSHREIAE